MPTPQRAGWSRSGWPAWTPASSRCYDAVLCGSALFVMADPDAAAAGFHRVLRPGGRCAVSVPAAPVAPGDGRLHRLYAEYARQAPSAPGFAMRFGMDPGALLRRAGFTGVTAVEEETTVYFRDAAAWWDWTWTVGTRSLYERLTDAQLDELRTAVLALLTPAQTPDGLPGTARAVFAIGTRPA
ncbi:class I SAM-dependent methyltransferase [Nocardiopsis coralliicola]